jgi:glycosyltransferase involved in cell wall biosynthesis
MTQTPKKILIDARLYGLEHTGIGRYLVNLVEDLKIIGTDYVFVILLGKGYFGELMFPSNWKKVLADFRHYSLDEQLKLPGIINAEKPDLVHFPHFNMPLLWNGKFVVTLHDMAMHKQGINATTLSMPKYFIKRIPYRTVFRRAVTGSEVIITPSQTVKEEITGYFNVNEKKIKTIYEGLTPLPKNETKIDIFKKYDLPREYFVYVGNAYPHKNLKIALDAIKMLWDKDQKNVILAVAASRDTFTSKLMDYAKEKKSIHCIKFLGFVPDEDLSELYRNSIAFVYPSLSEGFGLQGVEAISAGTVVLASGIPIFKEIYGEFSFYFDPRNVISVVKTMEYIFAMDPAERKLLIEKSQDFIKKYSWRKMAQETLKVYESALQNI